jgi:hypothetical protein
MYSILKIFQGNTGTCYNFGSEQGKRVKREDGNKYSPPGRPSHYLYSKGAKLRAV